MRAASFVKADRPDAWSRWYLLSLLVPPLLAGLLALLSSSMMSSGEVFEVAGARLGMTAEQVRERVDRSGAGSWRMETEGTELALIREPGGSLDRRARFEFHSGMLVAVRTNVPREASIARGDRVEASAATLVSREPQSGGRVEILMIARDCPTHADEVRRIVQQADSTAVQH